MDPAERIRYKHARDKRQDLEDMKSETQRMDAARRVHESAAVRRAGLLGLVLRLW